LKKQRRETGGAQEPPGLAARRGAVALLGQVLDKGAMLGEASDIAVAGERAAARGLADLALRRLAQIDDALARFVDRPPKGASRHILRIMAAELLFAGTPAHAAVDTAVRLARGARGTARTAGLINAVGRRLAEQGAQIVDGQDERALALPGWLRKRLVRDWGEEVTAAIAAAHLSPAPHDLTLANPADAEALAAQTGATILPTGSLRLPGRPQISVLPGFSDGAWWVQDAAAAMPVRLIPAPSGSHVLDLCAAPGGKTMQLAAAGAEVVALDQSEGRMKRLAENLARTGLSAETVVADAFDWRPDGTFDAILLDAPCSATGTIRRHPDLPLRGDGRNVNELIELQRKLLDRALSWLAPGGVLIYCACSLFKAEGEGQITRFLRDSPHAVARPITQDDAVPPEFVTPEGWLRTRPDQWAGIGGIDGFFAARIGRVA